MVHIASYPLYPLAKIHLYQNYINMPCHLHMNLCGYVNIVQKIINRGINVNAKDDNGFFFFFCI
jgi:hypothetical protein